MAATAVRLRYAGEVRPVAVKQKAWEDSVAHPKLARAEDEPEEQQRSLSSMTADTAEQAVVDDGVPVAAVDEKVIQQDLEHHGNM